MNTILNFNVGLLGHVDSGKTSLGRSSDDGVLIDHGWKYDNNNGSIFGG